MYLCHCFSYFHMPLLDSDWPDMPPLESLSNVPQLLDAFSDEETTYAPAVDEGRESSQSESDAGIDNLLLWLNGFYKLVRYQYTTIFLQSAPLPIYLYDIYFSGTITLVLLISRQI